VPHPFAVRSTKVLLAIIAGLVLALVPASWASAQVTIPPGPIATLASAQPVATQRVVHAEIPPGWAGAYFATSYLFGYASSPSAVIPDDENVNIVSIAPPDEPLDRPVDLTLDVADHNPEASLYFMMRANLQGGFISDWSVPLLILGPGSTPPPGKQRGRVTSVTWSVGATTPLWNMDVQVGLAAVSCPATLVLAIDTWEKRSSICDNGGNSPATLALNWKVFNANHQFTPGTTVTVVAYIARSKEAGFGDDGNAHLVVPFAPALIGVGDSYTSGHHQDVDNPLCVPQSLPVIGPCHPVSLIENDSDFSWITRLGRKLNASIPPAWTYRVVDLAQSGATTRQMFEQGQIAAMAQGLAARGRTWSIVGFTGGANNAKLDDMLSDFYSAHKLGRPRPWNVTEWADCPDTQAMYARALSESNIIRTDLTQILVTGRAASNTTRFLDALYPYVLKAGNICQLDRQIFPNPSDPTQTTTWHGAGSVVDTLDDLHLTLTGADVIHVDLRSGFGDNPLPKLQQTRYYGYPHPDDSGQSRIANLANDGLR